MTAIQWTDETWNPTRGCSVVSPGCVNCYAMKQAHRFSGEGKAYHGLTKQTKAGPQWTGRVVLDEPTLLKPLSWQKPRRVFVNSMSDLFHESLPDDYIDSVFAVMALARQHTFQVLTKRAERMRTYVASRNGWGCGVWFAAHELKPPPPPEHWYHATRTFHWPLPNVWLGVSVENQYYADERIPLLLQTPAAVRFISAEPLLGKVELARGRAMASTSTGICVQGLDWVIVGGESGVGARDCDLTWIRAIIEQCDATHVPVFVKQLGARPYQTHIDDLTVTTTRLTLRDRKGGDWNEWPEYFRRREFPMQTIEAR